MSVRHLDHLFQPRSVAVIGASDREHSLGATVMHNLLAGGYTGPVWPVNPKHGFVAGRRAYAGVSDLPEAPGLAVICTPAATVPGLIDALGRRGTRAAIVISAGLSAPATPGGPSLRQAMLDAARPFLLRILGPNCVGLLVPGIGLNASFAHTSALPGELAFVSQSGGHGDFRLPNDLPARPGDHSFSERSGAVKLAENKVPTIFILGVDRCGIGGRCR